MNQGWIKAGTGGNIVLVAPNIENSGIIQTDGGQIVLAAGQKMTIGSLDLEGVQFEIQAPADSVLNVGKLLADGGAVGVFAGTLKHTGDIRANALARDAAGRIVLRAQERRHARRRAARRAPTARPAARCSCSRNRARRSCPVRSKRKAAQARAATYECWAATSA